MNFKKQLLIGLCIINFLIIAGLTPLNAIVGDTPMAGLIALLPYSKMPNGWIVCDGRTLPVEDYKQLAQVLGSNYICDDNTNFRLPDLKNKSLDNKIKYCIYSKDEDYPSPGIDQLDPYVGEICLFFDSMAKDSKIWQLCDGSSITQNRAPILYQLIQNNYGSDGSDFKIPDLREKSPVADAHYYIAVEGTLPKKKSSYPPINPPEVYYSLIGSIALYSFEIIPEDALFCNGERMKINDYQALYSLTGSIFGGNSFDWTFTLPNLVGKEPMPKMKYCIISNGIYPDFWNNTGSARKNQSSSPGSEVRSSPK